MIMIPNHRTSMIPLWHCEIGHRVGCRYGSRRTAEPRKSMFMLWDFLNNISQGLQQHICVFRVKSNKYITNIYILLENGVTCIKCLKIERHTIKIHWHVSYNKNICRIRHIYTSFNFWKKIACRIRKFICGLSFFRIVICRWKLSDI